MADESKAVETRPIIQIVALVALVVLQIVAWYVLAPTLIRGPWWLLLLLLLVGMPIVVVASIVWRLLSGYETRATPRPTLTAGQRRLNAAFLALGLLMIMANTRLNTLWLPGLGILVAGLPNLLRDKEGKIRFSLARLFYLTTVAAATICMLVLMQRYFDAKRVHDQWRMQRDLLQSRREGLESRRASLSPVIYQEELVKLELEERELGPEPSPQ